MSRTAPDSHSHLSVMVCHYGLRKARYSDKNTNQTNESLSGAESIRLMASRRRSLRPPLGALGGLKVGVEGDKGRLHERNK